MIRMFICNPELKLKIWILPSHRYIRFIVALRSPNAHLQPALDPEANRLVKLNGLLVSFSRYQFNFSNIHSVGANLLQKDGQYSSPNFFSLQFWMYNDSNVPEYVIKNCQTRFVSM